MRQSAWPLRTESELVQVAQARVASKEIERALAHHDAHVKPLRRSSHLFYPMPLLRLCVRETRAHRDQDRSEDERLITKMRREY
jgi:hypothetical protein